MIEVQQELNNRLILFPIKKEEEEALYIYILH